MKAIRQVEDAEEISCGACSLINLCLGKGLEQTDLDKLDQVIEKKTQYDNDEFLFHSGDAMSSVYAVRSGMVKTLITTEGGAEQITGFHLPGELVGLDGFGCDEHLCNAVALGTTTVCELKVDSFEWACENINGLRSQLLRMIGKELNYEQGMLMALGQMKADERLATTLLSLSGRYKQRGFSALEFNLSMPRHDLANYLGLAPETLSRIFSKMHEEGVLDVRGRDLRILDMPKMRKLAHCSKCNDR